MAFAQESAGPQASPQASAPVDNRAYGILPNYRTANFSDPYQPLTAKRKFYIARKDSFDYPIFILGGFFAGLGQVQNQHEAFGQGAEGFAKRYAAAFADQSMGNYFTEGLMPVLFHQDPRYFRRGEAYGSTGKRIAYAASRLFVTRTDHGNWTFNFSEVVGNMASAGVANAYYPGERRLGDNLQRFYTQLGTDALSQVLKEFWPDVKRKFFDRSGRGKQDSAAKTQSR